MKVFRSLLLALFLIAGPAAAHQDRILTLEPDGTVPEIPASFGKVVFTADGLGTKSPVVRLTVGDHSTTLPACMTRLIRTRKRSDIRLSGSWYHDEEITPYYINVEFPDPNQDQTRPYRSGQKFLFNLHNSQLIEPIRFKADASGKGGKTIKPKLREDCLAEFTSLWPNNSFKPNPHQVR